MARGREARAAAAVQDGAFPSSLTIYHHVSRTRLLKNTLEVAEPPAFKIQ